MVSLDGRAEGGRAGDPSGGRPQGGQSGRRWPCMASVTIFTATELVVLTSMLVVLFRKRAAQLCPVNAERW